jgi:hypothetical protein
MTAWHRWAWVGVRLVGVPFGDAERGSWRAVAAVVVRGGGRRGLAGDGPRDVAERLTWLSGFALAFGFAFLLDAVVGTGGTGLEVGPTAYFVGVAAAVVTERVLGA